MSDLKKTAFTSLYENDVQEWEEVMGYQVAAVVVGTEKEYAALRTDVIAQDYSMLYKWFVEGPAARETVNALVSRDVAELPVNRIAYAAVVNEDGGMVDDVTVSVLRDDALLVIGGNPEVFDALNQAAP
ncbi:MAG TPA: hypothetical protein VNT53_09200, partial [Pseudolysinimonas sp.]|nr:hypothetical protein [Pseudolysinimonas sp.]